ncbi:hypothetical protein P153DRAFT_292353 [Dothidotthia symphoricarpi CBS 119687]|uniref:Polycomb protein VEFS-Box domain-containing protein n=1 Tax=Dothidotthia symphoricarpi CBS 119687 TaxID=1392245 RepID=A0A6A6ACI3_9PLEO|nr:uncharacterized protein P153DRAFT_292353 [Dothidotthia symphoricarpi CBS 119687]KAF2128943.1 hypothetical protein P153DRAFT_292353 [Dothidotthia symphoricarpi CBS 119687]
MVGQKGRYAGNILLYEYLSSRRAPVFLRRNLERVLHINQHLLEYGTTDHFPGPDHDFRAYWDLPSHENLDDMMEDSEAQFVLDIHGIKLLNPDGTSRTTNNNTRLPKKARTLHLKCVVEVKVWAALSGPECAKQDLNIILSGKDGSHGRDLEVQTEPINPIRLEELSTGSSGLAKDYTMIATINFKNGEDAQEFHAYFGSKTQAQNAPGRRLTALWSNILECPEGTVVLPLKGNSQLDLGLEVSMCWSSREESILTAHNRHLKSLVQATRCPSPPVEEYPNSPRYELTFVYANETITRSSVACPHCTRKPANVYDLRMHLQGVHDHFDYTAIEENETEAGVSRWRFECDVADHKAEQRASHRADEPFDVRVMAPEDPFDRQRFLDDGDDSFQQAARKGRTVNQRKTAKVAAAKATAAEPPKRKLPEEVQARPRKDRRRYPVPKPPPRTTFFRQISKRPLKEGEYISESDDDPDTEWLDLRKAAENRKDEQISASAERFLKTYDRYMRNEHLQSDNHAGDALIRFAREMGVWLWQERLFDEFKAKVGDLLEENIISKKIHAGSLDIVEAQKPKAFESSRLSQRLAELHVESSHGPPSPEGSRSDDMSEPRILNKGKARVQITDTGFLTPVTADGDVDMPDASPDIAGDWSIARQEENEADIYMEPIPGRCLCGQDALPYPRKCPIMVCNDVDCIRFYFHLDCVRKRWKVPDSFDPNTRDWTCGDCQSRND